LLNADTVRGEFDHLFCTRLRISRGGTSRQERASRPTLSQTTVSVGVSVLF